MYATQTKPQTIPKRPSGVVTKFLMSPSLQAGVAWSHVEHAQFLQGLKKLGKGKYCRSVSSLGFCLVILGLISPKLCAGNWRGISKYYVQSRTPTQVASHAQVNLVKGSYFVAGRCMNTGTLLAEALSAREQHTKAQVQVQRSGRCGTSIPVG